jgi:hypothetical protein
MTYDEMISRANVAAGSWLDSPMATVEFRSEKDHKDRCIVVMTITDRVTGRHANEKLSIDQLQDTNLVSRRAYEVWGSIIVP